MRILERPQRIFAYGEPVDMRKSFAGLIFLTTNALQSDALSGDMYVFINRAENYMKALFWDRTGFVIVAKRLERGKFKLPRSGGSIELDNAEFSLIFDGILLGVRR